MKKEKTSLNNKKEKPQKDKCILCGCETPYNVDDNINLRKHYITGAGQLCEKCYASVYKI